MIAREAHLDSTLIEKVLPVCCHSGGMSPQLFNQNAACPSDKVGHFACQGSRLQPTKHVAMAVHAPVLRQEIVRPHIPKGQTRNPQKHAKTIL